MSGSASIYERGIYDRAWLKELRIRAGLQQNAVAEAIGCTMVYYCRLENGNNKPGIMLGIKLADLFNFDIHKFAEEERIA